METPTKTPQGKDRMRIYPDEDTIEDILHKVNLTLKKYGFRFDLHEKENPKFVRYDLIEVAPVVVKYVIGPKE